MTTSLGQRSFPGWEAGRAQTVKPRRPYLEASTSPATKSVISPNPPLVLGRAGRLEGFKGSCRAFVVRESLGMPEP